MDHDDDGETSYDTFVDDVAFEPTYLQALLTAAGAQRRNNMRNNVVLYVYDKPFTAEGEPPACDIVITNWHIPVR